MERFIISWNDSGRQKYVSRINLRFKDEDKSKFEEKLETAQYYRQISEVYMRYNYMISKMDSETTKLNEETKNRIMYFVLGCSFKNSKPRDIFAFHKLPISERYNCMRYICPRVFNLKSNYNFVREF